jgi:stage V sporulation protein AA
VGTDLVYLQLKKRVKARVGEILLLKDLAQLLTDEDHEDLNDLPILRLRKDQGSHMVVDVMDVLRKIRQQHPEVEVRSVGPLQTIIEVEAVYKVPSGVLVALVWLLLFIGSALAIMNFHTDVSMKAVHERIYYLITGEHNSKPLLLQIPYSIGIGLGMVLFFNHLFKRKFNDEPSPLELEVFLYQENIDQFVIDHEKSKDRGDRNGPSG